MDGTSLPGTGRPQPAGAPPGGRLVGRDHEWARLAGLAERAASGSGALVVITGEAGVGKTRLLDELVGLARARGWLVVWAAADPVDRSPFRLWSEAARDLGLALPADPALPAADHRWEVLDALSEHVQRRARKSPVVLALDDLHWADEPSLWVLERLARATTDRPVLLAATSRPGTPGQPWPLDRLVRRSEVVALTGLGPAAVAELAADLGRPGVDGAALVAQTGGIPLFVRELVNLTGPGSALPSVVGDVLLQSLNQQPAAAQEALWALAVAEQANPAATPLAVVADALDRSPADLRAALDPPVASGILVEPVGTPRFRHILLAEAALTLRPASERRRLHAALARAWDAQAATPPARAAGVRHRLLAAPLGDPLAVAGQAGRVAAELAAAGDPGAAIDLLDRAVVVVGDTAPEATGPLAALLVDVADLRSGLGETVAAAETYSRAAGLAAGVGDPELAARAEIGAARRLNLFVPDLDRIRHLAAAEASLAPGDNPLRARLLGRRAIAGMGLPDEVPAALALADQAVEMARRIGDPEVLVDVLCDRHQTVVDRPGVAARAEAVREMLELSRRLARPDLALRALEWRFTECLERGDGVGARATGERLDALAAVMPSPIWRFTSLVRLHSLAHLDGDRDEAQEMARLAFTLPAELLNPGEGLGLETGMRVSAGQLWGRADPRVAELYQQASSLLAFVPAPFFQVRLAATGWFLGDEQPARRFLARHASRPDRLLAAPDGLSTLHLAALLVADLGVERLAGPTYAALAPFAGLLGAGNSVGFNLPIDAALGRLALLQGRVEAAVAHHRDAVRFAVDFPSPPMEARGRWLLALALDRAGEPGARTEAGRARTLADRIGLVLEPGDGGAASGSPPAARPPAGTGTGPEATRAAAAAAGLRRRGPRWEVASPLGGGSVPHSPGLAQLAQVLAANGRELAAVELAIPPDAPRSADLGPALDARAKREYRRRVEELQADIDEAERNADPARAERAQLELEAVLAELRRALGLGGRDRPVGSSAERARVNVTRSLKRAIAAVTTVAPGLGAHLDVAVQTGRFCRYRPDPAATLIWTVDS